MSRQAGLGTGWHPLPDHDPELNWVAADEEGRAVDTSTRLRGEVDAISYDNGYPELRIDDARVLLGDVRSVEETPTPTPTTTTTR